MWDSTVNYRGSLNAPPSETHPACSGEMEWPSLLCLLLWVFFLPSDGFFFSTTPTELPTLPRPLGSSPTCPRPPVSSPSAVSGALGGGGLLQRRQQTLLGQVGLQGVEDVELLVHAQRQELLDDLGGVGTPEEEEGEGWRRSTSQLIGRTHHHQAGRPAGRGVTSSD